MIVKQMRALLSTVPDFLTPEQFDELPVLIGLGDGGVAVSDTDPVSVITLSEPCDKDGNPLPDDGYGDVHVFLISADKEMLNQEVTEVEKS